MKIRKATIKDFEKLKQTKLLSKKEEQKYSTTMKPLSKTKNRYFQYMKIDLKTPHRAIFIAEENNEIVGFILAQSFKPLPISKYRKKGYISNLYVNKAYRGKGIGKKLIFKTLKWLKQNKVKHITLEIHIKNKFAKKLYHKLGFKDYTIKMYKEI